MSEAYIYTALAWWNSKHENLLERFKTKPNEERSDNKTKSGETSNAVPN